MSAFDMLLLICLMLVYAGVIICGFLWLFS